MALHSFSGCSAFGFERGLPVAFRMQDLSRWASSYHIHDGVGGTVMLHFEREAVGSVRARFVRIRFLPAMQPEVIETELSVIGRRE